MRKVDMLYRNRYTGPGEVVLLCEGDILGHDCALLRKWLSKRDLEARVDVTPCGTKTAIYGLADALGRARPVFVVEDRDHRSPEEATEDCERDAADRGRRDCMIIGWHPWKRNEIENYLLEPLVVEPALAAYFGCEETDVRNALAEVLPKLCARQALNWAVARLRREWAARDPAKALTSSVSSRPVCEGLGGAANLREPDEDALTEALHRSAGRWLQASVDHHDGLTAGAVVEMWKGKLAEWSAALNPSGTWLVDFEGKEVLQYLCRLLAARFGWRTLGGDHEGAVDWSAMQNETARRERDRAIERGQGELLRERFLMWIAGQQNGPVVDEWTVIADMIDHEFSNAQ